MLERQPPDLPVATAAKDHRSEIVLAAGSLTTLLALGGVFALAHTGTNVMGWYANYIIPVGALLVGLVASSGYGIAAWYTGLKMTKRLLWAVCGQLALSYFIAQYEEYRTFVPDGVGIGFWRWFDETTQAFAWSKRGGGAGEPFGLLGYAMRGLEIAGFVCGGVLVPLALRAKPYCDPCRVYKRTSLVAMVPAEIEDAGVDAILAAVRDGERDRVVQAIETHGSLARKRAVRKRHRYFNVELQRCPRCDDGAVVASVVVRDGNQVRITPLARVDLPPERLRALF